MLKSQIGLQSLAICSPTCSYISYSPHRTQFPDKPWNWVWCCMLCFRIRIHSYFRAGTQSRWMLTGCSLTHLQRLAGVGVATEHQRSLHQQLFYLELELCQCLRTAAVDRTRGLKTALIVTQGSATRVCLLIRMKPKQCTYVKTQTVIKRCTWDAFIQTSSDLSAADSRWQHLFPGTIMKCWTAFRHPLLWKNSHELYVEFVLMPDAWLFGDTADNPNLQVKTFQSMQKKYTSTGSHATTTQIVSYPPSRSEPGLFRIPYLLRVYIMKISPFLHNRCVFIIWYSEYLTGKFGYKIHPLGAPPLLQPAQIDVQNMKT